MGNELEPGAEKKKSRLAFKTSEKGNTVTNCENKLLKIRMKRQI